MANDVSVRLKAVRLMHGLSQRELAKRAGVTNGMISLIEQGREARKQRDHAIDRFLLRFIGVVYPSQAQIIQRT